MILFFLYLIQIMHLNTNTISIKLIGPPTTSFMIVNTHLSYKHNLKIMDKLNLFFTIIFLFIYVNALSETEFCEIPTDSSETNDNCYINKYSSTNKRLGYYFLNKNQIINKFQCE